MRKLSSQRLSIYLGYPGSGKNHHRYIKTRGRDSRLDERCWLETFLRRSNPTTRRDKTTRTNLLTTTQSDDLEKADIPDWLSGIAPEGALGEEKPDPSTKRG